MKSGKEKVIAFDFDGVIAEYTGFVSATDEKPPIQETVRALQMLRELGYKILIHSSRGDDFLKMYLDKHTIPYDYINRNPNIENGNPDKPPVFAYVDDRAICFKKQTADELVSEIENFTVYWRK